MAARPTSASASSGSEPRPTRFGSTARFPLGVRVAGVLLGLVTALPAWAQWDEAHGPGMEAQRGSRGAGRFIPEIGEDRAEPLVARSLPRFRPPVKPQVATALGAAEFRAVKRSFALAVDRVESSPSCAALFSGFSRDGATVLRDTYYMKAGPRSSMQCAAGIAAFTHVGGHRCWLCPHFGSLSTSAGAVILIHEALHAAGLSESTLDPAAPAPLEINRMVRKACSLE